MNNKLYSIINRCRICDGQDLSLILDLGNQPPANSLRKCVDDALPSIPLAICRCDNCTTIQLTATVSPAYLFSDYVWVTGTSPSTHEYGVSFYREMIKRLQTEKAFILEIASNDGTFLKNFKDHDHKILGVDPAKNIAKVANDAGIPTLDVFFSMPAARQIKQSHGEADCVYARNVIPHVENVHDVLDGMAYCLKDNGIGAIEFHYAQIILDELHYDSIYHEHLCYHSIESITYLLKAKHLYPFDVIQSPISGGSLVLYFSKQEKPLSQNLRQLKERERQSGMATKSNWNDFAKECIRHKNLLKELIEQELIGGAKIIGYGASARSSTLLNFCKIDHKHLHCIADQNQFKHNTFAPGTGIPIVSPQEALCEHPDVVLLLAWNFKNEIISTLRNKFQFKGRIIIPLPETPQISDV